MSDQDTIPVTHTAPAATSRTAWVAPAAVVVAVLALGAGLGALGGWLWYRWWGPPREGEIYDTVDGPTWYDLTTPGLEQPFAATAQYVVVGLGLGLLLGILAGLLGRRQALAALAALVVACALAASVAFLVGDSMSPPDPQSLVDHEPVGTELPAAIDVTGWTPYLSWPIGGLVGFLGAIFVVSLVGEVRQRESDTSTWLERQP